MKINSVRLFKSILIPCLILIFSGNASAEEDLIGSEEFRLHCAACHGVGGKGNGPIAALLNVSPGDLTVISKKNDGVYPFLNVFHIIDGRQSITAHGDRTMPLWGERYRPKQGKNTVLMALKRSFEAGF